MQTIQTLNLESDYGTFVLEPLERGYGQTIGNALRRVLLSSIQGAAICAIRIDKVFHEFAPIPGVKEDTTEFLLNLKDVAIRYTGTEPLDEATLTINVKGPGRVTGADIVCPDDFEIVNPEVYLATISDSKATLAVELKVNYGQGYTLPEKQERYRGIIGLLPTGAQFTPVKKVNYTVEQTRVGQRTDFERLVLDVWTNGAVVPNDAVSQAARILEGYFRQFFELGDAGFQSTAFAFGAEDDLPGDLPHVHLDDLHFQKRTANSLRRAGLIDLRSLALVTEADLKSIRGFGEVSMKEVRDKLAEYGVELRQAKGGAVIEFNDSEEEDED